MRDAVASADKAKVRPALVLLLAGHHLDNLWRLESHLGPVALESESPWAATATKTGRLLAVFGEVKRSTGSPLLATL